MLGKRIIALVAALLVLCGMPLAASARTVTLPAALTVISNELFYGDSSITDVVVQEGVTTIGTRAFADCGALTVTLPPSVTTIASTAFGGNTVPTILAEPNSYAWNWATDKGYTVRPLSYIEVKDRIGTNLSIASTAYVITIEEDLGDDWTGLMDCGGANGGLSLYSSWNSNCTAVELIGLYATDYPKYSLFGANTSMTYTQAKNTLTSALSGWQIAYNEAGELEYVSSNFDRHVYLFYTGSTVDAIVYQLDVEPGSLLFTIPNQGIAFDVSSVTMSLADYDPAAVVTNLALIPFNSNPTITWTSSDTSVATVKSDGWVYPVKAGTTVITAQTSGGYRAQCRVVVTD